MKRSGSRFTLEGNARQGRANLCIKRWVGRRDTVPQNIVGGVRFNANLCPLLGVDRVGESSLPVCQPSAIRVIEMVNSLQH